MRRMKNPAVLKICLLTFTTMRELSVLQFLVVCCCCFLNHTVSGQYYYNGMERTIEQRVYTHINSALQTPDIVYHIDLRNQKLTTFPDALYKFPNLRSIILSGNAIDKVDIKSNTFQNVVTLDLSDNRIHEFLIGQNSLTYLKKLNLDNNQLVYFPQLGNYYFVVEDLSLRYNYIAHIPMGELFPATVKFLYLDNNPIKNHEVIFREGTQLEELYLYQTGLRNLPQDLSLERLAKLNLGNNPLEFKSFKAKNYPKLVHLDIGYVDLTNINPFEELNELKKLRYLSLESCNLTSLSAQIGGLKSLKEISLLGNELNQLPVEFYELKLKLINLQRNPLNSETVSELIKTFKKSTLNLEHD